MEGQVSLVNAVLWQAFTLTFVAEWGDRSQVTPNPTHSHSPTPNPEPRTPNPEVRPKPPNRSPKPREYTADLNLS
jgi:hypothetical protein